MGDGQLDGGRSGFDGVGTGVAIIGDHVVGTTDEAKAGTLAAIGERRTGIEEGRGHGNSC
jgi:hypothetical protein